MEDKDGLHEAEEIDEEDEDENTEEELENIDDEQDDNLQHESEENEEGPSSMKPRKLHAAPNKKAKRGIIYLPCIPEGKSMFRHLSIKSNVFSTGLNPRNARSILSRFGEIDRIYFVPSRMRKGIAFAYKEGWIEFLKKRIAKEVAFNLNGTPIQSKRKCQLVGQVWTMKYLHRFKWHNLSEDMNYERHTRDQRMQLEMGNVRKESEFFAKQMDELKRRKRKGLEINKEALDKRSSFYSKRQRKTADPERDSASREASGLDSNLLTRIFS
jgi:ESF2/ABP1 family protein